MFDASLHGTKSKKGDKKRLTGFGIREAAPDEDNSFPAETAAIETGRDEGRRASCNPEAEAEAEAEVGEAVAVLEAEVDDSGREVHRGARVVIR